MRFRLSIIAPIILYLAHAALFGTWIIDDAATTFAYARNLASGHGLVPQLGAPPVEGFSNLLWLLCLTPWFAVHLFHPVWTAKAMGVACVCAAFALTAFHATQWWHWQLRCVTFALVLAALQPGIVIWSVSGLENGLYLLMAVLLLIAVDRGRGVVSALVALLLSLTRPDGAALALFAAVPFVVQRLRRQALLYVATMGAGIGALSLWRHHTFALWLPQTYYAKGGLDHTAITARLVDAARAVSGVPSLVVVALGIFAMVLRWLFQPTLSRLLLGLFAAVSLVVFCVMPADWMGEYRFATPFLFFAALALADVVWAIKPGAVRHGLAVAMMVWLAAIGSARSLAFAEHPPLPATWVTTQARRFDERQAEMSVDHASVLTPDIGGFLLNGRIRVIDMAGLCDRTIAATIFEPDPREFHNYIFDVVRPTFITMHPPWDAISRLEQDPRLSRDYAPLGPRIEVVSGRPVRILEYVRRDALAMQRH